MGRDRPGPDLWFCYHRAVQDSAAPGGRGGQQSLSRRDVFRYAAKFVVATAVLGLGTLSAPVGGPKASAAGMQLIDFAERRIPPDQIKSAGYDGVVNYVSESRPGANFEAKPLTREYADALRAAGLHIVSNFQYGKPGWPDPSDFTRGYDGGVADAHSAMQLHAAAGGTNTAPIFFSVDDDIDQNTWNGLAVQWFRGLNSVLGVDRTGIYGHAQACGWAIRDGVIGHSTSAGYRWAWQTRSWSHGEREPMAVLYQTVVNSPGNPGPLLGGINVDVDDVLAADFGQWDLDR
jgi:Rv2525c-like, glycoside hydrolase-like domain